MLPYKLYFFVFLPHRAPLAHPWPRRPASTTPPFFTCGRLLFLSFHSVFGRRAFFSPTFYFVRPCFRSTYEYVIVEHLPRAQRSTTHQSCTKQQSKHMPIRARRHIPADRVGESQNVVEHIYIQLGVFSKRTKESKPARPLPAYIQFFFCSASSSWHPQVVSLHKKSWTFLSASSVFFSFLAIERYGRWEPPRSEAPCIT